MILRIMIFLIVSGLFFWTACQNSTSREQEKTSATQTGFPQLMKIPIANRTQTDSLLAKGLDLIVVEDDYVVARLEAVDSTAINAAGVTAVPITEQDLVQRLVKIPIADHEQIQTLADMGMDIWEARDDTVVAQVFDKHIRDAQQQGFSVIIVEDNVQNLVKQQSDK